MTEPVPKNEEEWKAKLTSEQYRILREKGTEAPFTGKFNYSKEKGMYVCGACGNELFSSETKFESGSGWPSFFEPAHKDGVRLKTDDSLGMHRTEVICGKCGSHLGHVFDDGPQPTGQRFCINSVALDLKEK